MKKKIFIYIFVFAGLVVLFNAGWTIYQRQRPLLSDEQPHLTDEGLPQDWFVHPSITLSIDPDKADDLASKLTSDAKEIWVERGLSSGAAGNAAISLEYALKALLSKDVDSLQTMWKLSGCQPLESAQFRIKWFIDNTPHKNEYSQLELDDQIRLAVEEDERFGTTVEAIGEHVLAGVRRDFMKQVVPGLEVFTTGATRKPPAIVMGGGSKRSSSDRMASIAFPARVYDVGDVWIEIVMAESIHDAYWYVDDVSIWFLPDVKRRPDQLLFLMY